LSSAVAEHNKSILQAHGNNLQNYLLTQKGTHIYFGSEFRDPDVLHSLFCHHPNWPKLKKILEEGSNWPLRPISQHDRLCKYKELVERGNHKSALKYSSELSITLEKEIQQGWMFPLPLNYVSCLDHGELAPIGMDDKQWSDLPDGSKKVKLRLTHDQSLNTATGKSVNDRYLTDHLEPLLWGLSVSANPLHHLDLPLASESKNYGREVGYKGGVPLHYAAWRHSSKMHNHASKLRVSQFPLNAQSCIKT
jgi:hypothetical protein